VEVLGSNFDMILNDGFSGFLQSFHANTWILPYSSSGEIYSSSFELKLHGRFAGTPVNVEVSILGKGTGYTDESFRNSPQSHHRKLETA